MQIKCLIYGFIHFYLDFPVLITLLHIPDFIYSELQSLDAVTEMNSQNK